MWRKLADRQKLAYEMYTDDKRGDIYVYDIEVDGTEIRETYVYQEKKDEGEVRQQWLEDVANNNQMGRHLAQAYKDNVKVTALWKKHNSAQQADREAVPIPPRGLPGETLAEAKERRLSSKTDTEQN